jgi:cellobiose phosphorylase
MSTYGFFDDNNKEYVITNPKTPIKWINYVGTLNFGGFIDGTGGALICKQDPALNRITKYIAQMPQSDFKGSTLYIRVTGKNGTTVFSPFLTPTLKPLDLFECRVGLSYTRWVVEAYGVRAQITAFVPENEEVLLQDIQVTNISNEALSVDIIPVYEFSHFDALKQLVNADWVPQTMAVKAHSTPSGHVTLEQYAFMKRDEAVNFVTCDRPVDSFDGDRRAFLGENEFGSWANPLSLHAEHLSNSECDRGDNIAALRVKLGTLEENQTERCVTQLGQAESINAAAQTIEKFRNTKAVDTAFTSLADYWENYLGAFVAETPDPAMNSMLNIHNPRQCHTTKNWSRYLSLYQLGYGARGIGFRDSSQDLIGVMSHMPEEAREFLERLLSVQNSNGSAMHQYFPLTMEANEGDSREEEHLPKFYGDDHLWAILACAQYVKETGNIEFLSKEIPFYSKTLPLSERETGTVLDHLKRGLQFTWENIGSHDLPLLGFADWNDTVNLPSGAESLFVANLFGRAIVELRGVIEFTGDTETLAMLDEYHGVMKERVNTAAWDGDWWVRYFTHEGTPIGSHKNSHGSIYTNGQSWPVMSGFAEGERAKQGLQSVYEKLNTKYGIKLAGPGYDGYDPNLGGVSTYPPGAKENGGIFLHSNPWVMIAETLVGNGDRAYEYYNQINPAFHNNNVDVFESEPYCYPQNILGDEHKQFGMGRNAWLSGTASWTYVAGTQHILGIRPTMSGLEVNPCIPSNWSGFKVTRRFRGCTYHISVINESKVNQGVKELSIDGKTIEGQIIPLQENGEHHVTVKL